MTGSSGSNLSDKDIAMDILTSKKHLANYYYAPAILESSQESIRSAFQRVHSEAQEEAKEIFNYLNMRGWYNVRQADEQSVNELRNTAMQSRQAIQGLSQGMGQGTSMSGGNFGQTTGMGFGSTLSGSQSHWTGTQYGEGQTGMGPSSLSQGVSYGGQPSHMMGQSGMSGGYQGVPQQVNLPSWTRGTGLQGQQMSAQSGQHWTGTQYGEGQTGMGPSSLSQGVSYGGQPSFMTGGGFGGYQAVPQQVSLPSWTRGAGTQGQQLSNQGFSSQGWTGTQYGEGSSGMGPSSLSQGMSFGGQSALAHSGFSGGYQGVPQQVNLPSWTRGTGISGGQQGFGNQGSSVFGAPSGGYQGIPQQINLPSWTQGAGIQGSPQGGFGGQGTYFQSTSGEVNLPSWAYGTVSQSGGQGGGMGFGNPGAGRQSQ